MGAIGGLLGLSGGASGTGYSAPTSTAIVNPTNSGQISTAYGGTQQSMAAQNALLAALQGQNGLSNQSQVYGQLQGVASGAVNPAQANFNNNTAQNIANTAAIAAGQRGATGNVGLIARQAAQQGAATQQQAVGQEAAQQATNQIAAIGQAGNLATTEAGQEIGQTNANTEAQQAQQAALINAQAGVNNANVSQQSNINSTNAGLAQTTMGNQQNVIGGVLQGGAAVAGMADGGEVDVDPIVITPAPAVQASKSSSSGSSMAAMAPLLMAAMADGGEPSLGVDTTMPAAGLQAPPNTFSSGPQSKFGTFLKGAVSSPGKVQGSQSSGKSQQSNSPTIGSGFASLGQAIGNKINSPSGTNVTMDNGSVAGPSNNYGTAPFQMPDMGSDLSATPAAPSLGADLNFARGGQVRDFRSGGKVSASSKAEKAAVRGNSLKNDKIPAVLSEHEIVIPRSITLGKNPVNDSAKFVAAVIAKRKMKKGK